MFCSIKEALLGSISMHEGRTRSEATFLYCVMTERKSSLSRRYLNAPIFVLSQTRVIIQLTGINLRHFFKSGESHSLRIVSVTKMTALFHNAWQRRVVYICDIVFTRFLFTEPQTHSTLTLVNKNICIISFRRRNHYIVRSLLSEHFRRLVMLHSDRLYRFSSGSKVKRSRLSGILTIVSRLSFSTVIT